MIGAAVTITVPGHSCSLVSVLEHGKCKFQEDYLIEDLVKWDCKGKEKAMSKIYRGTRLKGKHYGDKDDK